MTHQEPILRASEAEIEPKARVCPNCGEPFAKGGRGLGKTFCSKDCRVDFNNRAKAEGAIVIALVKVHHQTRHARAGTREAAVCSEARRELAEIVNMLLEADEAASRPPLVGYVEELLKVSRYIDRTRKF